MRRGYKTLTASLSKTTLRKLLKLYQGTLLITIFVKNFWRRVKMNQTFWWERQWDFCNFKMKNYVLFIFQIQVNINFRAQKSLKCICLRFEPVTPLINLQLYLQKKIQEQLSHFSSNNMKIQYRKTKFFFVITFQQLRLFQINTFRSFSKL